MKYSYTITAAEAGQNLMHFCKRMTDQSFGQLQKSFRTKAIRLNGAKDDGKSILQAGDVITSLFPIISSKEVIEAPDLSPYILFEDTHVLALNKPSGIAVHKGSKQEASMDTMVAWHFRSEQFTPKPAHRLDKDTSGVLLYGKTIEGLNTLTEAFRTHTIQKTYRALVHGIAEDMTITASLLTKDDATVKTIVNSSGQEAITQVKVTRMFETHTDVTLRPKTGRTHQLRVHMAYKELPIIGDPRYGDNALDKQWYHKHPNHLQRLYLHCASMQWGSTHIHAPVPWASHY